MRRIAVFSSCLSRSNWISGELSERFRPRVQGQLYITQRSWVDILCWHDLLPKLIMRVEPDEKFIKALDPNFKSSTTSLKV